MSYGPGRSRTTGSGSSPYMDSRKLWGSSSRGMMEDVPTVRRYCESQQLIMELRAIDCVEAQLGRPLRDDGPMLGMEFDSLPPDSFGAIPEPHKRFGHPYESKVYEGHDGRASKVDGARSRATSFVHGEEPLSRVHGILGHGSRAHVLP